MKDDSPKTALFMLNEFCDCYELTPEQKKLISNIISYAYHEGKINSTRQFFKSKFDSNE